MYELMIDPHRRVARITRPPDTEVLTRRVDVAVDRLEAALWCPDVQDALRSIELGDLGWFEITAPLSAGSPANPHPVWRGRGRIHHSGPGIVRWTRVEVEFSAWSRTVVQLSMRPSCRYPLRWGERRLRRYFAAAHAAADRLSGLLAAADRDCEEPIAIGTGRPTVAASTRGGAAAA